MGQETDYIEAPAVATETTHETFTGSIMSGRSPSWGAQLGITDGHLGVSPLNTQGAQRGLGAAAHVAGISGFGGINAAINTIKPDPLAIPFSEITSVSAGSEAGLFSPPTARIETTSGSYDVGVTGSLWTRSRSDKAREARDDFVSQLDRRIGEL
jgi:hypothetical protein